MEKRPFISVYKSISVIYSLKIGIDRNLISQPWIPIYFCFIKS